MDIRAHLARPQLGFDLLRIYLGVGLVVRGGLFASDPGLINQLVANDRWLVPMLAGHAIVLAHLIGGLMLALGLCTRLAAAVQIPPLAGAVFVVHWSEGLFSRTQSLEFAALVLVALTLFAMFGSGELSLDYRMARGDGANEEEGADHGLATGTSRARPRPSLRGAITVDDAERRGAEPRPKLAARMDPSRAR